VPPIADVRLTIAPARGMQWIRLSSTVRRLGLGLAVVLVVGGIGLFLVPDHVFPRLLALLGVAVLVTAIVTLVRANSSGRVRVEVGRKEVAVIGIRTPLAVPIRDIGSACIVSRFRQGLGFKDPMLMMFNRKGRAIFSLAGRPWAMQDWEKLLKTVGVTRIDRIAEPMSRKQFERRYPEAHTPADRVAVRKRKRLGLILGVVWGVVVIVLILR
jgi:hypothetical protein